MKNVFFLFFLLYMCCSCTSKTPFEYATIDNPMRGDVKLVREMTFDAATRFGEVVKEREWSNYYVYSFDNKGRVVSYMEYGKFGEEDEMILMKKYMYEKGKLVETTIYGKDGLPVSEGISKIRYNYHGMNTVEMICFGENEEMKSRRKFIYEGKRLKEEFEYDIDGKMTIRREYVYRGRKMKGLVEYNTEGNIDLKTEIVYKRKGPQKMLVPTTCAMPSSFVYGGKEWLEALSYGADGKLSSKSEFEIDKNGNILKNKIIFGEGTYYYEYDYEYDKYQNWIRRIVYKGDTRSPLFIEEREIEYR